MSTISNFSDWVRKINQRIVSSLEEIRKPDTNTNANRCGGSLPGSANLDYKTTLNLIGSNSTDAGGKLDKKLESFLEDIKADEEKGWIKEEDEDGKGEKDAEEIKNREIEKSDESTLHLSGGNSTNVGGKLEEKLALKDIKVEEEEEKREKEKEEEGEIKDRDSLGIISFFVTNSMITWKLRQIIEEGRENLQNAEPVSADILNNQTITQNGLTVNLKNAKAYNVHSFEFKELVADKTDGTINYLVTAPYVSLKVDVEMSGAKMDWKGGTIDIKFVEPSLKGLLRFQLDPFPQMIKSGVELDYDFRSIEVTGASLEVGDFLSRELEKYLRENEKDILGKMTKRISDNADGSNPAAAD